MKIQKNRAIYIGLLIIVWACAYVYIFNEKIDIHCCSLVVVIPNL